MLAKIFLYSTLGLYAINVWSGTQVKETNKFYINFKVKPNSNEFEKNALFFKKARKKCKEGEILPEYLHRSTGNESTLIGTG